MNEDKNTENHAINTGKEELVPQEYEIRLQKVKELRSLGIEPWAAPKKITATAHEILEKYQDGQEAEYAIAGRVMTIRLHGKSAFAHVQDESGTIQVYVKQDAIGDSQFEIWNKYLFHETMMYFNVYWHHSNFLAKTSVQHSYLSTLHHILVTHIQKYLITFLFIFFSD